jgi:hypothetical protein
LAIFCGVLALVDCNTSGAPPPPHCVSDCLVLLQVHAVRAWAAYPKFAPPEQFNPFVLAPGIFYGNEVENWASAMEMSAIAGVNSALLGQQHLATQGAAAGPGAASKDRAGSSGAVGGDGASAASAA